MNTYSKCFWIYQRRYQRILCVMDYTATLQIKPFYYEVMKEKYIIKRYCGKYFSFCNIIRKKKVRKRIIRRGTKINFWRIKINFCNVNNLSSVINFCNISIFSANKINNFSNIAKQLNRTRVMNFHKILINFSSFLRYLLHINKYLNLWN